jgi:hypothetical protein
VPGSLVLSCVVLGAALALVDAGQARAVPQARATLHVVRLKPFTVRGAGFKANERVVLRLTGDAIGTARGTATARGRFTLKFSRALTSCSAYTLRAIGARGTRALLKPKLRAACKPVATADFGPQSIVKGSRFKPGERLTVTLIGDGTRTRKATANAKGQFEVDFGALSLSNCSLYTIKIKGSKGSVFTSTHLAVPC